MNLETEQFRNVLAEILLDDPEGLTTDEIYNLSPEMARNGLPDSVKTRIRRHMGDPIFARVNPGYEPHVFAIAEPNSDSGTEDEEHLQMPIVPMPNGPNQRNFFSNKWKMASLVALIALMICGCMSWSFMHVESQGEPLDEQNVVSIFFCLKIIFDIFFFRLFARK
jgi:hypothetical protein